MNYMYSIQCTSRLAAFGVGIVHESHILVIDWNVQTIRYFLSIVLHCSNMLRIILTYTERFKHAQKCSERFNHAQKCSERFNHAQKCSDLFRHAQTRFGLFRYAKTYSSIIVRHASVFFKHI